MFENIGESAANKVAKGLEDAASKHASSLEKSSTIIGDALQSATKIAFTPSGLGITLGITIAMCVVVLTQQWLVHGVKRCPTIIQ